MRSSQRLSPRELVRGLACESKARRAELVLSAPTCQLPARGQGPASRRYHRAPPAACQPRSFDDARLLRVCGILAGGPTSPWLGPRFPRRAHRRRHNRVRPLGASARAGGAVAARACDGGVCARAGDAPAGAPCAVWRARPTLGRVRKAARRGAGGAPHRHGWALAGEPGPSLTPRTARRVRSACAGIPSLCDRDTPPARWGSGRPRSPLPPRARGAPRRGSAAFREGGTVGARRGKPMLMIRVIRLPGAFARIVRLFARSPRPQ